jgi:hypothetical protein
MNNDKIKNTVVMKFKDFLQKSTLPKEVKNSVEPSIPDYTEDVEKRIVLCKNEDLPLFQKFEKYFKEVIMRRINTENTEEIDKKEKYYLEADKFLKKHGR